MNFCDFQKDATNLQVKLQLHHESGELHARRGTYRAARR